MLTSCYKESFNRITHRIARILIAWHISPNMLTVSTLGFLLLACFILYLTRNLALFCVLVLLFGLIDALDGAVARVSGKITKFGSYLDAMVDRYYEAIVAFAVACMKGDWPLYFLLMSGGFLTSYAKARAAMEIPVENNKWPDFLERLERSLIFLIGLFISEVTGWTLLGKELFFWVLVFLIAGTHVTVLQRMLRAKKLIQTGA